MRDIWFYSDPHFGHASILTFKDDEGNIIREGFKDINHMNEELIIKYNSRVKHGDIVYLLGDIAFQTSTLNWVMPKLNGSKRLILGNHDRLPMREYIKFFSKIYESRKISSDVVMTHRPIHIGQHDTRIKANIHGHTHHLNIDDPRYFNASVEQHSYYPVHLDEVMDGFKRRGLELE